jgi:8-oxo-dGTP pyrophosphatase MutT (NUDIX family)
MVRKFSDEEYAVTLPKKIIGTAVLLFNSKGELLILKPDYKDGWLVPGGSTNENESPLHCAIRETREEIGLDIPKLRLVGVYYGAQKGFFTDSLKFVFSGDTLTEDQIVQIKLQTEELEEYAFSSPEKALPILSPSLQKSLPACLEAMKNKTVAYVE